MSIVLDIIIVAIFALTVYFAARNGFVKTAISAVSFILAIIMTATFTNPLAELLKQTPLAETVESVVTNELEGAVVEGSLKVEELFEGKSEDFNRLLGFANLNVDEVEKWFDENVVDTDTATSRLAERIAIPIIDVIAKVVAVIILFIGTQIILSILSIVLNNIAKLPILRSCNKFLGILLGVVLAVFRVFLFCFAMSLLIENADYLGAEFLKDINPDNTLIFAYLDKLDIFQFLI